MYGLPAQSVDTIRDTVARTIDLNPGRVALFGYAHVPWMKKHQKLIDESALPSPAERLELAEAVIFALRQSEILRANLSFFCLNADSFTDWNPLSMMLETPEMHGALLALKVDDPSRYGTLKFDLAGNLQSFEEKTLNPTSSYINGGVYHFQKTLFEKDNMIKSSLEYDLFPRWLHENKNLGVVKSASGFIDIGTPESFQLAQSFFEHKS